MNNIQEKTKSARLDTSTTDVYFRDSFTGNPYDIYLEDSAQAKMASGWIDI